MPSTQTKIGAPTVDAAFEQVKGLNEQFLGAAGQAGTRYLDAYEKAVDRAIELELKVAGYTQQEWLKTCSRRGLTSRATSRAHTRVPLGAS